MGFHYFLLVAWGLGLRMDSAHGQMKSVIKAKKTNAMDSDPTRAMTRIKASVSCMFSSVRLFGKFRIATAGCNVKREINKNLLFWCLLASLMTCRD